MINSSISLHLLQLKLLHFYLVVNMLCIYINKHETPKDLKNTFTNSSILTQNKISKLSVSLGIVSGMSVIQLNLNQVLLSTGNLFVSEFRSTDIFR